MTSKRALSNPILRSLIAIAIALLLVTSVRAELFDSLDAYPPRLNLDTSDCDARVIEHKSLSSGGVDGGGCESITFQAGVGSEAILLYPIEPVHPLNDLVATLSLMSARPGARVGLRVRFPYFRDAQTRRPVSAIIYGASYERKGRFQKIGVGNVERELRIKIANLRAAHGADTNLSDPYIDAIAINAYSGPGLTTLKVDQVAARGMVSVGDFGRVNRVPGASRRSAAGNTTLLMQDGQGGNGTEVFQARIALDASTRDASASINPPALPPAFPQEDVIRILEHQGEPLQWVRAMGFDAVLLSSPPTADILREAIRTQVLIYAPPPIAPDPSIITLLDPVMAWYLGGGMALDQDRVAQTDRTVRRLRKLPLQWQRPIVIAPVENWAAYGNIADAVVCDTPLRLRGLPASEQSMTLSSRRGRFRSSTPIALAVSSSSPPSLIKMNRAIETRIGTPPSGCFRWHALLTQVVQCLEQSPRAIVFRSHESLATGEMFAHQRSMAISYINRFVAMVAPWVASARTAPPYQVSGAAYRCGRLISDGDEFLLLTSDQSVGDQVLAGDGRSLQISLPPEAAGRAAWRLTGFSAERVDIEQTSAGARLEIVSPDFAEIIVISRDTTLGARLAQSARRFAARAASDRWQLCGEHLRHTRDQWNHAVTTGATEASVPMDLLAVADQTLRDAESAFRAGDSDGTLRLARRADAWGTRAAFQLSQALLPRNGRGEPMRFVSVPPIDEGKAMLQIGWQPLMQENGWSRNLIASGGLDQHTVLHPNKWNFGQRKIARAESQAGWISRGFFSGGGAVRLAASSIGSEPLGGGYEGTIAMLASPPVSIDQAQAIRIDAMIRTIGFGGAHQGILVYDSVGGQELGVLVRGASEWTPVRLYRQSNGETELRVMFEVIGDGEAIIDEISVRAWTPDPLPALPLRPIDG